MHQNNKSMWISSLCLLWVILLAVNSIQYSVCVPQEIGNISAFTRNVILLKFCLHFSFWSFGVEAFLTVEWLWQVLKGIRKDESTSSVNKPRNDSLMAQVYVCSMISYSIDFIYLFYFLIRSYIFLCLHMAIIWKKRYKGLLICLNTTIWRSWSKENAR